MLRVALRPRFLGLLALMVAATLACGMLASWQWERAHHAITDQAAGSELLGDIRDVVGVGDAVTNAIVGETVTATGTYVPGEQVLVPGRNIDGTRAVLVVSALRVELEDGTSARLPIARGWLPAEDLTGPDGRLDAALVPAPPQGEVAISGRLEASEAASGGVSDGITREIATPLLVNEWGSPMFAGYVALDAPDEPLRRLPAAESEFTRNLDLQNIGYSLQWVLFGAFFLYLWWRSVRATHLDEVAEHREAMERMLHDSADDAGTAPDDLRAAVDDDGTPADAPAPAAALVGPSRPAAPAATLPPPDKDV